MANVRDVEEIGNLRSNILFSAATLFLKSGFEATTIKEIASGGIMRGSLTIPCDMYFTMERKAHRFSETAFLVYRVPDEKINEILKFVSQFDFVAIAQETVAQTLSFLKREL